MKKQNLFKAKVEDFIFNILFIAAVTVCFFFATYIYYHETSITDYILLLAITFILFAVFIFFKLKAAVGRKAAMQKALFEKLMHIGREANASYNHKIQNALLLTEKLAVGRAELYGILSVALLIMPLPAYIVFFEMSLSYMAFACVFILTIIACMPNYNRTVFWGKFYSAEVVTLLTILFFAIKQKAYVIDVPDFMFYIIYCLFSLLFCLLALMLLAKRDKINQRLQEMHFVMALPEMKGFYKLTERIQTITAENMQYKNVTANFHLKSKDVFVFVSKDADKRQNFTDALCRFSLTENGQLYINGVPAMQLCGENFYNKLCILEKKESSFTENKKIIVTHGNENVLVRAQEVAQREAGIFKGGLTAHTIERAIVQNADVYIAQDVLDDLPDKDFLKAFDKLQEIFDETIIILTTARDIPFKKNVKIFNADPLPAPMPEKIKNIEKNYTKEKFTQVVKKQKTKKK